MVAFDADRSPEKIKEPKGPENTGGLPSLGDHTLEQVRAARKAMSGSQTGSSPVLGEASQTGSSPHLKEAFGRGSNQEILIARSDGPPAKMPQQSKEEISPQENQAVDEKRLTELTGKKVRTKAEERELDDLLQFQSQAQDAKLLEQRLAGTISKEDNARLIGREEFGAYWAKERSELVKKEVLGTISEKERATLAGWREFGQRHQGEARELSKEEALGTIDEKGAARLAAWRQFPLEKFARARDLAAKEGRGEKLTPEETKDLANYREQPRIPVPGLFSIVSADDNAPEKPEDNGNTTRAERVKKLAKAEFPDDPEAQKLVLGYMNGELNRSQAAKLKGLRAYKDDPEARGWVEEEYKGLIKPDHKAALVARREFQYSDPNSLRARILAAGETLDTNDVILRGELKGRREFQSYVSGVKVEVPPGAIELAQQEYLKTISPQETQLLQQARLKYKEACEKAMDKALAPPPPS